MHFNNLSSTFSCIVYAFIFNCLLQPARFGWFVGQQRRLFWSPYSCGPAQWLLVGNVPTLVALHVAAGRLRLNSVLPLAVGFHTFVLPHTLQLPINWHCAILFLSLYIFLNVFPFNQLPMPLCISYIWLEVWTALFKPLPRTCLLSN